MFVGANYLYVVIEIVEIKILTIYEMNFKKFGTHGLKFLTLTL